MICYKLAFIVLVFPFGQTIRVNMQGAISLGKEIADNLADYIHKNTFNRLSGRRALGSHSPSISTVVNSGFLCRHLKFCQENYEMFINEYIITQTESMEAIFKRLIKKDRENLNAVIFELELKKILKEVRQYLELVNDKINDDNEVSVWMELLKKISVLFKERAMTFGIDRLEGNVDEMHEVKKKLQQTLIITTTTIELQYERKLCSDHKICQKRYNCSKSLYELLDMISSLSEVKVKRFIKIFNDALTQSNFYFGVGEVTADEFKSILKEMAFSDTIETKKVFSILKDTVKRRIDSIKTNKDTAAGIDVKLVHVILSDMDYFYSKHKGNAFEDFLTEFNEWSKSGGNLSSGVSKIMKDLTKMLAVESEDVVNKLVNEVKVFMEITVDPEN